MLWKSDIDDEQDIGIIVSKRQSNRKKKLFNQGEAESMTYTNLVYVFWCDGVNLMWHSTSNLLLLQKSSMKSSEVNHGN